MAARRLGGLLVLVAALAGALLLLRPRDGGPRSSSHPPVPAEHETDTSPAPPAPPPGPGTLDPLEADLALATATEEAPAAAARLRERLRTDAAALRRAEQMLLDPGTPPEQRIVLAIVLGTIGDSDPAILSAIQAFGGDAAFVRAALLALGATREPREDDDVFDLGNRPWGVEVGALGITVRRTVDDAATRAAIATHLLDEAVEARLAAAKALRHSVATEDTRAAFLATLDRETDDDVTIEIGESLAGWAATAAAGDRQDTVRRILSRVGDASLDGYRFRLEDDLARVPLQGEERSALEEYARGSHPLSVRTFALTVLAGGAVRSDAVAATRDLLTTTAEEDPDRAVRDVAARLLSRLPYDATTVARLARIARSDPEWSLRYTAVDTLGSFGKRADILAALTAAKEDPDARVSRLARELSDRLSR